MYTLSQLPHNQLSERHMEYASPAVAVESSCHFAIASATLSSPHHPDYLALQDSAAAAVAAAVAAAAAAAAAAHCCPLCLLQTAVARIL